MRNELAIQVQDRIVIVLIVVLLIIVENIIHTISITFVRRTIACVYICSESTYDKK